TPVNMNAAHPASVPPLYKSDLPGSQESRVSTVSSTFSAPQLPSSSSNLSTSTDTELTTPPLSQAPLVKDQPVENTAPAAPRSPNRARAQAQNALLRIDAANLPRTGDTAASPMSLYSPATHGSKRTADGSVKGGNVESSVDTTAGRTGGHKRSKSMDTSRIGEVRGETISAQLKTRLSYAMVKVQNGWEKQSLEELEEQTSQQGSPISTISRSNGSRPTFDSPLGAGRARRPSGVSETSDHVMMSPHHSTPSDPSRSLATTPPTYWRPGTNPTMNAAVNLITVTGSNTAPMLGPAPDLSSRRKRRSSASYHPPPLLGSNQRRHYSDLSGTPRTPAPATPRAGILRMPSQQAEKDAVDTLLFMSSPNNSGRVPHTSTADGSHQHQRPAATPRRVMFEGHPAPGKSVNSPMYHPSQAPSSQPTASYYHRAEPSR
ncbi:hypothetical protein DM02DRAFT_523987, partial [Periconia macrospinosa]